MEYQLKKKQILQGVEYSNLLSFALTENKLEKNFKSIVEAIMLAQAQNQQTREDVSSLQSLHSKEIDALKERINALEKQFGATQNGKEAPRSSKRNSIQKQEHIEEKEKSSIHTQVISSPNVVLNYVQSDQESSTSLIKKQQGQNKENDNANLIKELADQIKLLKEDHQDSKNLQDMLKNMKDNINGLKAEIMGINQRLEREKTSAKRVSIKNNMIQGKESVKEIRKNSNILSKKDLPKQSTKNIVPSNTNISQKPDINENKNTEVLKIDNSNLQEDINQLKDEYQREINGLHIQVNTIKICLEEIKEQTNDLKRKQNRNSIQLDDMGKNLKKIQSKVDGDNENYERQFKEIKMQMLNMNSTPAKIEGAGERKSRKNIENSKEVSPNYNSQINDKISKLQAVIQGMVTEAQFKRFKSEAMEKFNTLNDEDQRIKKDIKDDLQAINQLLDIKDQEIEGLQKQIDELKESIHESNCQCERKNNIAISRSDQLKKGLQQLKQDLEFYKSMNQMMNDVSSPKALKQNKEYTTNTNSEGQKMREINGQNGEELKKYFTRKMHDQRTFLLGQIRDLEKKLNGKNNYEKDIVGIWDKFTEINLFLGKKANEEDTKKSVNFLEKKIAVIMNRLSANDENTQDARIAKTNWFCLSCDKNLSNYQGKIGKHVPWDSMPIKSDHAKYYQKDQKKSLPSLKR